MLRCGEVSVSSLRDQLLAKGLVSKKKARQVARDLKSQRKQDQGARQKKREAKARAQAEAEAEAAAKNAERAAEATRRRSERERTERALQIRQILLGNRLKVSGILRFHHRSADGRFLPCVKVSERAAFQLRNGELGIAALPRGGGFDYVVVPRRAVERLTALAPQVVVFHVTDATGLGAPELALAPSTADGDLRAHRLTRPVTGLGD
ncbi:MAG: hypothetical protein ACI8PZ_001102 [Myxococcota bacterium]|jgi:uncharacterized protein YaiL (DUF2058 family)